MPFPQFLRLYGGNMTKMSMVTSVPLSILLVGLQAMIDVKFACPCIPKWNKTISALIFVAPACLAFVLMLLFLRPWKYECKWTIWKCCCCGEKKNCGSCCCGGRKICGSCCCGVSKICGSCCCGEKKCCGSCCCGEKKCCGSCCCGEKKCCGSCCCGEQNKRGASKREDKKEASQSEKDELDVNFSREKAVLACLTPSLVWICLCFIDGDYLTCGLTYWDGHYACDKELHPNCLNWCKPNDLGQGKKETEHEYEQTRNWIAISKTTGYALAIIFCFIAIIIVLCECCKSGKKKTETTEEHLKEETAEEHLRL
ncbi:uncharacterized protein LOC127942554 [Carassius gibelio]|uniref:uncharacterized protein LOC127942554 n=1 Tax=Carassius gibelio TaxID=101364 RepID=UPI002277F850|nr:uncharacterized protein LOC127942554 [Carassius gibelio]